MEKIVPSSALSDNSFHRPGAWSRYSSASCLKVRVDESQVEGCCIDLATDPLTQVHVLLVRGLWEEATERERRTRVEGMLDAVFVHPDHVRGRARGSAAAAGRTGRGGATAPGWYGTVGVGGGT